MKKNALLEFVMMFVVPILLWMFIFKSFLVGTITISMDTCSNFSMYKFFYNNLFNGVMPLWNPFVVLGVPDIMTTSSGVLSPFMTLFAALHFVGLNYYASYILFILFYFILGLAGFYWLAMEILENRFLAWVAFLALLFSGMGPMIFNQIFIYFIFCPAVWLFYFLFRFSKNFERKYFFGIICCSINMLCFYFPFYFLTLFIFFAIFLLCLYPHFLAAFLAGFKKFILSNKKIFMAALALMVLALLPLMAFKLSKDSSDLLFLSRRIPGERIIFTEKGLNQETAATMNFEEVSTWGTLGERIKGGRLFSHLDKYDYGSDDFFYIPVLIYLIIFITCFVSFGRQQFMVLGLGISIFILSLGQVSSLHQILFNTVFYFKYFRNFFFFMAFLIPLVILFAVFQLKVLMGECENKDKRFFNILVNTILHFIFLCFLFQSGNILPSTFITVILSCGMFNLMFFKPQYFKIILFLLLILEPVQVFASFEFNSSRTQFSMPVNHTQPAFLYDRPSLMKKDPRFMFSQSNSYGDIWYILSMQDSKGYIPLKPFVVTKYTYLLSKAINEKVFLNYIRHKFYLYDNIQSVKNLTSLDVQNVISQDKDLVLLTEPLDPGSSLSKSGQLKGPLMIAHDSNQFRVKSFDTNHVALETNFNSNKFLVYTDSYETRWKVFVNHHEQKLFRANMAFKGVYLPAGHNDVEFQYSPKGEQLIYLIALLVNLISIIYFIRILC